MKTMMLAGAAALAMMTASTASAADIWFEKVGRIPVIFIKGEIVRGDSDKFDRLASKLKPGSALVVMGSPGGLMLDGLDIGITIRNKRFATTVPNATCSSICGFMWLAGVNRFAHPEAEIGFHGIYDMDTKQTTSAGNALLGAYLSKLGLSYSAIAELTKEAHDSMTWLDSAMAKRLGIKITVLSK